MEVEDKCKRWQSVVLTLMVGAFLMRPGCGLALDNLNFRGVMVQEACRIRAGDETLTLDLQPVSNSYLYLNTRTVGKNFRIHLEGCDTSIADTVTTTFSGNTSAKLPGLLALDGASVAKGIAIGMETLADKPLPLNMASDKHVLNNGDNVIAFKVFIKAEPQALANKTIAAGTFTAISTFTLDYP